MRYNGGKHSVRKQITEIINQTNPKSYWEPFVGAANIAMYVSAEKKIGTDAEVSIISLLNAVKGGWIPPDSISETEYHEAKMLPETNPLYGFCKFGCSFGGKPWGGYARGGSRNYAMNAKNSLLKDKERLESIEFFVSNYKDMEYKQFDVIYCDPPYAGTTKVGNGKPFDTLEFIEWCREVSKHCTVFVSELQMPNDFKEVWSKQLKDGLGKTKIKEKLFVINP